MPAVTNAVAIAAIKPPHESVASDVAIPAEALSHPSNELVSTSEASGAACPDMVELWLLLRGRLFVLKCAHIVSPRPAGKQVERTREREE